MKMQNTEMEFVYFDAQDVITTSGSLLFTISGVEDGKSYTATIKHNESEIYRAKNFEALSTATARAVAGLNGVLGDGTVNRNTDFYYTERGHLTLEGLLACDTGSSGGIIPPCDGVYEWLNNAFTKVQ